MKKRKKSNNKSSWI